MTILKVTTASVLVAVALCTPAQADLLGKVGEVAGNAVSNVTDAADRAVGGLGGGSRNGSQSGGNIGASADVDVGGRTGSLGGSAGIRAGVKGVAEASVCVGVNASSGCNGSTANVRTPTTHSASSSIPQTAATSSGTVRSGGNAVTVSPDWLIGMIAYGSDNVMLGRIQKVSAAKNEAMPMITVQLDGKRRVQLRNAISVIKTDGVWLLVPAGVIDSRASGRMTRLALQ